MGKKDDLTKLLEVDHTYGEISPATAEIARHEADGCARGLVIAYLAMTLTSSIAIGSTLHGRSAEGMAFGTVGLFLFFASRYLLRELNKWDNILLAYTQRDHLRSLRGDLPSYPPAKKLKR